MSQNYMEQAKIFKAFCDANRLQILEMLTHGETCACSLLEHLQISQSTLSYHMKILCDSGVVVGRAQGKWTHYSLSPQGCAQARELITLFTHTTAPSSLECSCN
ncbi:metalloregulator ArsR/SmtB family transcription factor [Pseudoflavonifractor sp. An85]|uniref:ArsR/SmtB family transcription factor n=1 Tax=Pseudoflavonifractor sp. An85 TaxID=1965661 RepID=UPI000B388FE4|nr:metalloregulator ArsR/SmtB family transcription factor [Pseudoflavonifractor sp. An85]OUN25249.1 transcriptional regulator [Pseudoflavonifractor sp. An85]